MPRHKRAARFSHLQNIARIAALITGAAYAGRPEESKRVAAALEPRRKYWKWLHAPRSQEVRMASKRKRYELTDKERLFIVAWFQSEGDRLVAMADAFNIRNEDSARSYASQLLRRELVMRTIEDIKATADPTQPAWVQQAQMVATARAKLLKPGQQTRRESRYQALIRMAAEVTENQATESPEPTNTAQAAGAAEIVMQADQLPDGLGVSPVGNPGRDAAQPPGEGTPETSSGIVAQSSNVNEAPNRDAEALAQLEKRWLARYQEQRAAERKRTGKRF